MSELNLCGVLVHTRAEQGAAVRARLTGLPGVEVHALTEDGRLVLTVEDSPGHSCIDTITGLYDVEGVLSASVVYQHTDLDETDQESNP